MLLARGHFEAQQMERVSLERLGQLVAERQGREKPYANTVVGAWLNGQSEPENVAGWLALAATFGVSAQGKGDSSVVVVSPRVQSRAPLVSQRWDDDCAATAELATALLAELRR